VRELNQFLHHELLDSGVKHIDVLNPKGAHSIAVGIDHPVDIDVRARARATALLDLVVRKYAPRPARACLPGRLLGYGAPHLRQETAAAWSRRASIWQASRSTASPGTGRRRNPVASLAGRRARSLLAPFDPIVWDRRRFELLWGWTYASRPTRRRRSERSATTRCRCCGATR
jgi:uncharacterized protein YcaQ